MYQPPIAAYYRSRKRTSCLELEPKAKITKLRADIPEKDSINNVYKADSVGLGGINDASNGCVSNSGLDHLQVSNLNVVKSGISKGRNAIGKMPFEMVERSLRHSSNLKALKNSVTRMKEMDTKRRKYLETNISNLNQNPKCTSLAVKGFTTIDLDVLTSPNKRLHTPTKKNEMPLAEYDPTSNKNERRLQNLQIPAAYKTFQWLVEKKGQNLTIPYKYRCLLEIFKCLDTICMIFYKRKEVITFKKVKPILQRMLRKNFDESHLSQIKTLFPEAFTFSIVKMRNFGSTSKEDYNQLVITPNFNAKLQMNDTFENNPEIETNQAIIERQHRFHQILLNKVKDCHDLFLQTLNPPVSIAKDQVIRWHPFFNVENCPEIEKASLPQSSTSGKYASANHILATARNLFSGPTSTLENPCGLEGTNFEMSKESKEYETETTNILKNVPQALLSKIKAKQASKALVYVTDYSGKNPSHHANLHQIALYLRNVFITEKKNVLPFDFVVNKIAFSYQSVFTTSDIENFIRQIKSKIPGWLSLQEMRHRFYLRLDRTADLKEVFNEIKT